MSRYYNKDIKLTSIAAIFFTILPTLKMLFVCSDKFGSHHPEHPDPSSENLEYVPGEYLWWGSVAVKPLSLRYALVLRVC